MLAWQILVQELDSRKNVVDAVSKEGYTVVKGELKPVKVLQIVPSTSCNLVMGDGVGDHPNAKKEFAKLLQTATSLINYETISGMLPSVPVPASMTAK